MAVFRAFRSGRGSDCTPGLSTSGSVLERRLALALKQMLWSLNAVIRDHPLGADCRPAVIDC